MSSPRPVRRWLFFNYEFPPIGGGGGTCSRYMAKELTRAGHEVEVLTAAFGSLPHNERQDGYRVRRVRCLRAMAGQCRPYEMISYAASAFADCLVGSRPRPDLLVSFHSIPSGMPAWAWSLLRGIPHIILFQGGDVPGWLPGELEKMHRRTLWLNRWIVYRAAAAIANSDGLLDLARKSFPKGKLGAIYGGSDTDEYTPPNPPRESRAANAPCRLLFAGRLTTQKGLDVLLEALGRLPQATAPWRLTVAGDGPRRAEFEALALRLGLADRVEFLGFLERAELRRYYGDADVFAFPSRYEGMPNVVLEAMACGLPIVGTRIAGTEQLVRPEGNGLLVAADDVDGLSGALRRVIDDRPLRLAFGNESRRLAVEEWSWRARALELANLGEDILAHRAVPQHGASPR